MTVAEYLPCKVWLMKTEPDVFSFDDLLARPGKRERWDGVRNYQARNLMRDHMKIGDTVLFYHSNAEPPGIAGLAEVVSESEPDLSALDAKSLYFDPKATPQDPRWCLVQIGNPQPIKRFIPLEELKEISALSSMLLLRKGQRLSILPVSDEEFSILKQLF
jgi:predicted RNA-binding protein with PUA-like domain